MYVYVPESLPGWGTLGLCLHTVNKRPDILWSLVPRQHVFLPGKREQLLRRVTIVTTSGCQATWR